MEIPRYLSSGKGKEVLYETLVSVDKNIEEKVEALEKVASLEEKRLLKLKDVHANHIGNMQLLT